MKVEPAEMKVLEIWPEPKKADWKIRIGSIVRIGQSRDGSWYVEIDTMRKQRWNNGAAIRTYITCKSKSKFQTVEEVDAFFDALITIKEMMSSGEALSTHLKARATNEAHKNTVIEEGQYVPRVIANFE